MLSGTKKGLLVGLANLVVVGLVLGIYEGIQNLGAVLSVVCVVGLGPALAIGALCGWLGTRVSEFRGFVLIAVPTMVVVAFGVLSEPKLIVPAMPSTLLCCLWLASWTRPNLRVREPGPSLTSPATVGLLIGSINVAVVAMMLAIYVTRIEPRMFPNDVWRPTFGLHFAAAVMCLGVLPGMVVGAIAGFLAKHLRGYHTITRLAGIGSVAVSGVFALGALTQLPALVIPALMPTLFAVAVLEWMTRPIEIVPGARVHRGA